jgi:hypothetical protein
MASFRISSISFSAAVPIERAMPSFNGKEEGSPLRILALAAWTGFDASRAKVSS